MSETFGYIVAFVIAVLVTGYLIVAMLFPERF
jgi:K+-transporting ATPase KdpF subunit